MPGCDESRSYLVEYYWPGVSEQKLVAAARQIQRAAEDLRGRGHDLRFIGSIFVPIDETVFCLFDGTEADVRSVSEQARVPFERILESLRIGGG
ncbi:MAG TPA: hypothetical protein VFJ11_03480 [Gaiellaceae bacterium]|nr:hypothetical protein [Gaiellaceae bacterium]